MGNELNINTFNKLLESFKHVSFEKNTQIDQINHLLDSFQNVIKQKIYPSVLEIITKFSNRNKSKKKHLNETDNIDSKHSKKNKTKTKWNNNYCIKKQNKQHVSFVHDDKCNNLDENTNVEEKDENEKDRKELYKKYQNPIIITYDTYNTFDNMNPIKDDKTNKKAMYKLYKGKDLESELVVSMNK